MSVHSTTLHFPLFLVIHSHGTDMASATLRVMVTLSLFPSGTRRRRLRSRDERSGNSVTIMLVPSLSLPFPSSGPSGPAYGGDGYGRCREWSGFLYHSLLILSSEAWAVDQELAKGSPSESSSRLTVVSTGLHSVSTLARLASHE